MKVGFAITARMKSTRLPEKITLKINDREYIAYMIDRIKLAKGIDEIIIATSTNHQDDILCQIAKRENIKCFKGSEDDVLQRLYNTALYYNLDYIINLTADCALVGYEFVEKMLKTYKETQADLITINGLPHGFYFWGIKVNALKKILDIKSDSNTEVWLKYFTETGMKVVDIPVEEEYQRNYRLTLDYPEDFEFFRALFEKMGDNVHIRPSLEIIKFLDNNPEIVDINLHCEALYKKRWDSQNKLGIK
jgi:spore coat polysaccharide biosynthesis protein SpsF